MGSVVADHFLASGHPRHQRSETAQAGRPPLLGLVESTDRGRSWEPMSLLGEADVHSLAAAHGKVHGYDATGGRLMVSPDGKEWDTRSRLALGDFAVDPPSASRRRCS